MPLSLGISKVSSYLQFRHNISLYCLLRGFVSFKVGNESPTLKPIQAVGYKQNMQDDLSGGTVPFSCSLSQLHLFVQHKVTQRKNPFCPHIHTPTCSQSAASSVIVC